ncbi:MAG: DNA photolyase [Woeseiaceae bacterium]|nr:DNA photolyase [Woeseiaceae bacterium]
MSDNTPFGPGRAAGLDRLANFAGRAGKRYAKGRNFDFGPASRGNVSMLSPYIRHRLLTENEILKTTLDHHSLAAASKFVEEVFWRTYFKGWLEHRPGVWADYRHDVAQLAMQLETSAELRDRYDTALSSQTGIDCFDAWMAELLDTGYLHNHARMWFASIWVFTLGLPWQLGADLFYRHLIDGDPASNTLSWRWVSGLHTKGKTYLARASNIAAYTEYRFNPAKQLASSAPPLVDTRVYKAGVLPAAHQGPVTGRFGLLITEEDCLPESLDLGGAPQQLLAALTTESRSPLKVAKPARQFAIAAALDALDRGKRHYGAPGEMAQPGDWGTMLLDWSSRERLSSIVTAYAPVGPVAEQLARARVKLEEQGVTLINVRRRYDSVAWPHASKGYFKLKAQIPDILSTLGIVACSDALQRAAG